jgi:hypothetical protein
MPDFTVGQQPVETPQEVSFDEESGYLVLRLARDFAGLPEGAVEYREKTFQPKEELHITLVSRDAAEQVAAHLKQDPSAGRAIRRLIAETGWTYHRLDEYYHIVAEPGVETIVQMAAVPGVEALYRKLQALVGSPLEPPPTHITLYTLGIDKGIGLPTRAEFDRLAKGPVQPAELKSRAGS